MQTVFLICADSHSVNAFVIRLYKIVPEYSYYHTCGHICINSHWIMFHMYCVAQP